MLAVTFERYLTSMATAVDFHGRLLSQYWCCCMIPPVRDVLQGPSRAGRLASWCSQWRAIFWL
jgi:hypothetical protein